MKKTNTLKGLLLKAVFAYLLVASTSLYGQREYVFSVNNSTAVGTYDVLHAAFGPICSMDTITANLRIIEDMDGLTTACVDIVNDLTGTVALLDRGACNFSLKCYNAQQQGAVAVLVCNNVSDAIFNMGPGDFADQITIPSLMIAMDDCATIRAEIANGDVEVTAAPIIDLGPPDTDIIYYHEDFNAGPNGWTSTSLNEPDEVFYWSMNGDFPTFGGGSATISLPESSCSGAMGFPSGFYQTGMTGEPDSIPATYIDFDSELISPILDLGGITDAISLKWNQRVLRLNPNSGDNFTFVSYSLDGGDTWSDPPIAVNTDVPINSAQNPSDPVINTVKVAIPEIQNQPNVRVKLMWRCDFYSWIIDDVKLVKRPENDLELINNFYGIATNAMTPSFQVETMSFVTDISNRGSVTQPNTKVNVTIENSAGAEVYSYDLDYGDLPPDTDSTDAPFPYADSYTPDGMVDTYTGTYTVSSDSSANDFTPDNNSVSFAFEVTDSVFAKEDGIDFAVRPADSEWAGEMDPHSWAYGNFYHIVNGSDQIDTNSKKWYAGAATFGIEAGPANTLMTVYLYRWDEDTDGDGDADTGERTRIGFANYAITGAEVGTEFITRELQPVLPADGEPGRILLDDDTDYLLMVEFSTENLGEDLEIAAGTDWEYFAQTRRTDPAAYPNNDAPYRPADYIGVGTPENVVYENNGFGNIVPAVRLELSSELVIDVDELDVENIVNLTPNPADNFVNLNVDLVNPQAKVQVNIVDVTGKVVMATVYENVTEGTYRFDTSNLAVGAYFVHLITEEGARTNRLIIQR